MKPQVRIIKSIRLFYALLLSWLAIGLSELFVLAVLLDTVVVDVAGIMAMEMTFLAIVFDIVYHYVTKEIKYERRVQDIVNNAREFHILKGMKR